MMKADYPFSTFAGVDVSKDTLEFAMGRSGGTATVSNNAESIASELIEVLTNRESVIVVVEATGGYEQLLLSLLHEHNVAVAVVNPRRVRDFAKGIGQDAKTDPIDARTLAFYGKVVQTTVLLHPVASLKDVIGKLPGLNGTVAVVCESSAGGWCRPLKA